MVRYSNVSFFTLVEDGPYAARYSVASFRTSLFSSFQQTLSNKVEQLIILIGSKSSLSASTPYYVKDISRVNELEGSYTLDTVVQCSPDLDSANCGVCLRLVVQSLSGCCTNARFAQFNLPKCFLKYDTTGLPTSQSPSGSSSINVMKGERANTMPSTKFFLFFCLRSCLSLREKNNVLIFLAETATFCVVIKLDLSMRTINSVMIKSNYQEEIDRGT